MKNNRIKAYWLLLLVLLYTAAAVLSVGEAQARYVTTATWNTVVQQEEIAVTSDCLEDPEVNLTILLGTMPQEPCTVSFQLTAKEAASGNLTWTVDPQEYLSAQMRIGETVITPETTVELDAGETVTVMMTLTPSETAFTEIRDAVNVSVAVAWADTLKGTFLTQLPAVEEEEEEPTEETEPPTDVTEPPTDVTEPTEPAPTEPANPTEPTEPAPTNPTNPTEPAEPAPTNPTNPTEPAEPAPTEPTNPTETGAGVAGLWRLVMSHKTSQKPANTLSPNTETPEGENPTEPPTETEPEPTEDPAGQSEESEDPQNPETPGGEGESEEPGTGNDPEEPGTGNDPEEPGTGNDPEEPGTGNDPEEPGTGDDPEPTEPVQEEVSVQLEVLSNVNSSASLPIQITAPENGGAIHLGLASVIESADPEGEKQTVLEKFPRYTRFSLADGADCYMLYYEDTIALNLEAGQTLSLTLDLSHVNLEQPQVILGAASQSGESDISICTATVIPESAQYTSVSSRILSVGAPLEITLSEYWKDFTLEYTVEMLTAQSENGEPETLVYVPVKLPPECLSSELISDETCTKLIFTIGETLPPAGTYRVSLNWKSEDDCIAQMQEIFFINYSAYTKSEETGGAEQ